MPKLTAIALASAIALAACSDSGGGDPIGPNGESAVGSYVLVSINNHPMPFPLIVAPAFGVLVEYTFSSLNLTSVGGFQARDIVTEKHHGVVSRVDTVDAVGRWTQQDTLIRLIGISDETDTLKAGFRNGKLTYRLTFATDAGDSTYVFIYQRQ